MNNFLNYQNGILKVLNYRLADAEVTTLEDIQNAYMNNKNETLVASFDQNFEYDPDLKIAKFSGICANSDTGFEICVDQEAHNIYSKEQGLSLWGLSEDLEPAI